MSSFHLHVIIIIFCLQATTGRAGRIARALAAEGLTQIAARRRRTPIASVHVRMAPLVVLVVESAQILRQTAAAQIYVFVHYC